ncbi:MAG: type 4 pilus major pilin [Pseudomonadota bacterium]|nr:type 4 pilus major pilin [Pseudomonadota bacterium]
MFYKSTNMSGRSMIEMLGVLAIIGVLSVGGIAAFTQMMARQKISQTQTQINAIAAKISAIGSEASSYSGLNNKTAVKFGAIPGEAVVDAANGVLSNPFGGNITVSATDEAGDVMSYTITYTNLTKDACIFLATMDWGKRGSSFLKIALANSGSNNSYVKDFTSTAEVNQVKDTYVVKSVQYTPVAPADAAKGCSCTQQTCLIALKFN